MSNDNVGFWQKLKNSTSNGWNKIKSSGTYINAKEALKNNVGNIAGSVYNKASPLIDAALMSHPALFAAKKAVDVGIKHAPAATDMILGTKSKISKQVKDFHNTSSGNAPKWNLLETENAVVNPTAGMINAAVPYIPGLYGSSWRGIKNSRINVIRHRNGRHLGSKTLHKGKIKHK